MTTRSGGARRSDRTAAVLVRVWLDGEAPGAFRARVIGVDERGRRSSRSALTADPEALLDLVRLWLAEFLGE